MSDARLHIEEFESRAGGRVEYPGGHAAGLDRPGAAAAAAGPARRASSAASLDAQLPVLADLWASGALPPIMMASPLARIASARAHSRATTWLPA